MKGNIVTAAKLFGISLILSTLILAFGINLAVALHRARPAEPDSTPTACTTSVADACHSFLASNWFYPQRKWVEMSPAPSRPQDRMAELLKDSENLRQIEAETRRFWQLTNPETLIFDSVNGAVEEAEPPVEVEPIQCPKE
jgi:hypothetical protein